MKIAIHVLERAPLNAEQMFDLLRTALSPHYDVIIVDGPRGFHPTELTHDAIEAVAE